MYPMYYASAMGGVKWRVVHGLRAVQCFALICYARAMGVVLSVGCNFVLRAGSCSSALLCGSVTLGN